ncbi:MAG: glycosyltransferase family 4 protein [Verrucomicrobiota bacterium]|nr:glycosyltransferase family 4 protein [Verrucomicrobiota bacterium]
MKLLFYIEHFSLTGSGAENDAVNLCRALVDMNHKIHVVANSASKYDGITLHYGLSNIDKIIKMIKPDKTIDWGFFHQADIHRVGGGLHKFYLEYYIKSYPKFIHCYKKIEFKLKRKHREQIEIDKQVLRNPDAFYLPISNLVAKQLLASKIPANRIEVLYNSVNGEKNNFQGLEIREAQRKKWGCKKNDTVLLFIAHNLRLKNLKFLIKVSDELFKEKKDIKLVLCGKHKPKFKRNYLIYAGTTINLENFYTAADILVHPSYYDSFANVVFEAMACQLPVIVSNCCGVTELIDNNKNGFVLGIHDQNSYKHWIKVIKELIENDNLKEEIVKNALELTKQYSFTSYVKNFEGYLKHITKNGIGI